MIWFLLSLKLVKGQRGLCVCYYRKRYSPRSFYIKWLRLQKVYWIVMNISHFLAFGVNELSHITKMGIDTLWYWRMPTKWISAFRPGSGRVSLYRCWSLMISTVCTASWTQLWDYSSLLVDRMNDSTEICGYLKRLKHMLKKVIQNLTQGYHSRFYLQGKLSRCSQHVNDIYRLWRV